MTDEQLGKLLKWYEEARVEFASKTYVSKQSEWQRLLKPYKDWNDPGTISLEIAFNMRVQAKLQEHLSELPLAAKRSVLTVFTLALKNRAEHASNQADFYPVYVGLIAFAYTFMSLNLPTIWKFVLGASTLFLITVTVRTRVTIRRQVAQAKELVNLLESYEKKVLPREPVA